MVRGRQEEVNYKNEIESLYDLKVTVKGDTGYNVTVTGTTPEIINYLRIAKSMSREDIESHYPGLIKENNKMSEEMEEVVELAFAKLERVIELEESFKIVNRVRNGKVQRRKKVSDKEGFTIKNGKMKKISAKERIARSIGAKKAAKKRKGKQGQINKNTKRSLRKRKQIARLESFIVENRSDLAAGFVSEILIDMFGITQRQIEITNRKEDKKIVSYAYVNDMNGKDIGYFKYTRDGLDVFVFFGDDTKQFKKKDIQKKFLKLFIKRTKGTATISL